MRYNTTIYKYITIITFPNRRIEYFISASTTHFNCLNMHNHILYSKFVSKCILYFKH